MSQHRFSSFIMELYDTNHGQRSYHGRRNPSPFAVRKPSFLSSLTSFRPRDVIHSATTHMEVRRAASREISSRIESVGFKETNHHLIFHLLDQPFSLWMQTSSEDAALRIRELSSYPSCIGRCVFHWTYDIHTRQILRGPIHATPHPDFKDEGCIIL